MTRLSTSLICCLLAFTAAVLLPSCESSTKKDAYDDVVDYTTPKTKLSKEEYPFDDEGNYLESYAARGSGTANNKPPRNIPDDTAMYTQPTDDSPARAAIYKSSSYTPRKNPGATRRPASSSSSNQSARANSKPKPKPKPAAIRATYVKLKRGDTLYGLSKRYGVSVAAIKSGNGLSSDIIRAGKTLKIPPKKK